MKKGGRFDGVFTKLNAWNLVKYAKVLLLDLDTIPLQSLEGLFELQTPAAMVRGNSDWPHGMKVDGHFMFRTEDDPKWPWEQGGGINAGVILLEPCPKTFHQMKREVTSEVHPAHVPGGGPEQDYLSRFFRSLLHTMAQHWRGLQLPATSRALRAGLRAPLATVFGWQL